MTECGWIVSDDGVERWVTCEEFEPWESCLENDCDNEWTWDDCWIGEWRLPCESEENYGEVGWIYRGAWYFDTYWVSWAAWFESCM